MLSAISTSRFRFMRGLALLCFVLSGFSSAELSAQASRKGLREPVFRVAAQPELKVENAADPVRPKKAAKKKQEHALDEALGIARETLDYINQNVRDYTCLMVKRERINGKLLDHEFMTCKVRHARQDGGSHTPFSVYLNFRKPASMQGREVIYVEGQNNGKLIAHEGGFKGRLIPTVYLMPTSALAMRNCKYPITEIGIKKLTAMLIEKGERDRKVGPCKVRILRGAKVKNRVCTCIEVRHDDRHPEYDFHKARIFLDNELKVPIRYEAYDWPEKEGSAPQLMEEYTYMKMKLNVGLNDMTFSTKNPNYNY